MRDRAPVLRAAGPGDASEYIRHLRKLVALGIERVLLWCRVSGRVQEWRSNLDDQEANLRKWAAKYGLVVIDCWRERSSGWLHDDRVRLQAALENARELGVPLVAETTDRFIRSRDYHSSKNTDAWPTRDDFEALARMANGVTLATLLIPDAPPVAVRWFQQDRGKQAKGNIGGRPPKTKPGDMLRRRVKLLPLVLDLHEFGATLGDIKRQTGVPRMTASEWIVKYR